MVTKLLGWQISQKEISKTFVFQDFLKAIEFVNLVAKEAEKVNHHPDISVRYNKVEILLTTHEKGVVTEKDHKLAEIIDHIFSQK